MFGINEPLERPTGVQVSTILAADLRWTTGIWKVVLLFPLFHPLSCNLYSPGTAAVSLNLSLGTVSTRIPRIISIKDVTVSPNLTSVPVSMVAGDTKECVSLFDKYGGLWCSTNTAVIQVQSPCCASQSSISNFLDLLLASYRRHKNR